MYARIHLLYLIVCLLFLNSYCTELESADVMGVRQFGIEHMKDIVSQQFGIDADLEEVKASDYLQSNIGGSLNPYFLKYFELDFNSAEIEYFLKIKEGNQEGRIERKTKIDRIWIFKRTKPKFERLYIAFGDKNQSQVHGVVTMPIESVKSQLFFKYWLATDFEANPVDRSIIEMKTDTEIQKKNQLYECINKMCTIYTYFDGKSFINNIIEDSMEDDNMLQASNARDVILSLSFEDKSIENKNRTVEASVKVKFGFKSPNISSTVYYAGCISIMILFWSIGHIFNFQNLTFAEMNTPFPNRLVFFLSTTLAQLWISAILLFYGYLYPDLKFLGFALGFSTGGMCGFTSLNTVSIVCFNRFNIRSIKFFFAHCAFTLFYCALILCVVSPLSIWYIFMNINSYIIWSNIWIVMIALNIIFKTRCIINIWIRNCIAITICFSCLSILKPNDYFPSLSLNAAVNLSTFHFLCIILIWIQSKCGSRFFLPRSYRRKTYDKYTHCVMADYNSRCNLQCLKCVNKIMEPELEYSDSSPDFICMQYPRGTYIQLQCGHIFHPNCLLKQLESYPYCLSCGTALPRNTFDD